MIRVILADDHPIVRHGLRRLINHQADMRVAAEAPDGAELIRVVAEVPCDVLVLDLSLPHVRGVELVLLLRELHPDLRILIFSVQPEDQMSLHLIEAGVYGYLGKDHGVEAVLDAVRQIAAGRRFLTPRLQELAAGRAPQRALPHEALSVRERQVFDAILRGLSVTQIAGELEITVSTVSNHLSRIREKLQVQHNGEILVYAARAGLL